MSIQNLTAVLDVQSDRLSLVLVKSLGTGVRVAYRDEVEYSGYQNGEFFEKDAIASIVSNMLQKAESVSGAKIKKILIGVPGEFTSVKCRTIQKDYQKPKKLTATDLDRLHKEGDNFEAKTDYVCVNSSPIYYVTDSHSRVLSPIGSVTQTISCYISYVLMEKSFKKLFDSVVATAGVEASYCSAVLAEIMYIFSAEIRDNGAILLDVGFISTSVVYAKGDGILHCLSFSKGSGHIAEKLYQSLKIPYTHALELLRKINMNVRPEKGATYTVSVGGKQFAYDVLEVNEVCFEVIKSLGDNVNKALSLSPAEIPEHVPIFLTGSGLCDMVGARELLEAITRRPIGTLAPALTELTGPRFASVAALALYSISIKSGNILDKLLAFFDKIGG